MCPRTCTLGCLNTGPGLNHVRSLYSRFLPRGKHNVRLPPHSACVSPQLSTRRSVVSEPNRVRSLAPFTLDLLCSLILLYLLSSHSLRSSAFQFFIRDPATFERHMQEKEPIANDGGNAGRLDEDARRMRKAMGVPQFLVAIDLILREEFALKYEGEDELYDFPITAAEVDEFGDDNDDDVDIDIDNIGVLGLPSDSPSDDEGEASKRSSISGVGNSPTSGGDGVVGGVLGDGGDVGEGGGGGDNDGERRRRDGGADDERSRRDRADGGAAKKQDKGVLSYGGVMMKETTRWLKKRYLSYKAMFRGENSVSTLKAEARRRSKAMLMRDAALWGEHGNRSKNATMATTATTFRKAMQVINGSCSGGGGGGGKGGDGARGLGGGRRGNGGGGGSGGSALGEGVGFRAENKLGSETASVIVKSVLAWDDSDWCRWIDNCGTARHALHSWMMVSSTGNASADMASVVVDAGQCGKPDMDKVAVVVDRLIMKPEVSPRNVKALVKEIVGSTACGRSVKSHL